MGLGTNRMEAFSDGVIAIIITIMVLEIKVPHGVDFATLQPLIPVFFSYVLSFVYIGIYWNNHHHLLHTVKSVTAPILWTNLHLLFWLSLVPFSTGWMGENHFEAVPVFLYGLTLFATALAYWILQNTIIRSQGQHSILKKAVGRDLKGMASLILYASAIGLAFVDTWISLAIYVGVALLWLIPDRRIEKIFGSASA
ncbi:MAG TPA: TMEM175 family protein [Oligoflexus sp.]|uniref:TMEM175 family protein n=1 Tax=Oligoflexus sp. TaxID=1971216 RepID=UPI002D809548|nr:TMEM175 family protein [Oligoflexus sp.]HET9241695.1 TMEM175 family protein [Oligoflexus sp.]